MKSVPKLPQTLAFVDTETTGLNPKRDRVIELGIIRVQDGKVVDKLDTVVQPYCRIPPEIFSMTRITSDEIARAPDFDEVKHQVEQILDDAVFVAHNARFDYAFLKHEFGRHGDELRSKVLCTVRLTRKLFPKLGSYSLESIIQYFGLKPSARHRAFADASILWELYQLSLVNHGEDKVSEAVNSILKVSSQPANLPQEMIENLPETAGIYVFFGEDLNLPLYVGKSVNIKDRVKGHFSSDYQNNSDLTMSSQITKVEAFETAGEIGALIREADAVKALMPVYNKQLRRRQDLVVALVSQTTKYRSIRIENLQNVKNEELGNIQAIYRSKKNAKENLIKLSKEYNLCQKLLGLENGKGKCFGSQIGICFGACDGGESYEEYNARFREAFSKTRVSKWPFKKTITIREENIKGMVELHFVDKWMYLGSVLQSNEPLDEPKIEKYTPRFDWDIYKILKKAIAKSKNVHETTAEEEALFKG